MAIKKAFTKKEHTDSGLALILLLSLASLFLSNWVFIKLNVALVILLMIYPPIIFPFTFLWLNISEAIGKIISKILLVIIFFIIVCPVAFIRRLAGKDNLHLNEFKKSNKSVFVDRNFTFGKKDLQYPY